MSSSTTKPLSIAEATDIGFWRALCPELTIEGSNSVSPGSLNDIGSLSRLLCEEGYINEPDVLSPQLIAALRIGIQRLFDQRILPPFAFVYDEYWLAFRSLAPFLACVLGDDYRALPNLWAWYVPPSNHAAGWTPHRDRSVPTIGDDNRPLALTVWLPLTDTNPLNGCMYVLPAHLDPGLRNPAVPENGEYHFSGDRIQNIRALPATAGSLLAWNQSLLHWGSRSSNLGAQPRCSIAFQFQRGDRPAFETPLLDPTALPSFQERLGLIGHLICLFSGFLTLPAEMRILGTALDWKYWRGAGRA